MSCAGAEVIPLLQGVPVSLGAEELLSEQQWWGRGADGRVSRAVTVVRRVTVSNAARPGEGLRLHPSLTFVRSNLPLVFSLCPRVRLPVAYWPIKIKINIVTGNKLI